MTKAKGFQIPAAVSAEAKAFFEAAAPIPLRSADAASIDRVRAETRDGFAAASVVARETLTDRVEDIEIAGVTVQEVVPKGYDSANDGKAMLYFFGGGHVVGNPFEDLPISAGLARRLGLRVLVPHYRLAPEQPFPAALDDGAAVYEALVGSIGPRGLALAG